MLLQWSEEFLILGCALLLCISYAIVDAWFFKKFGSAGSTLRGNLVECGYDSTYGVLSALMYPIAVLACYLVLLVVSDPDVVSLRVLIALTFLIYLVLVAVLNMWGKRYLKSRGLDAAPKNGYKGWLQNFKDNYKEMREKQKNKDDDSF